MHPVHRLSPTDKPSAASAATVEQTPLAPSYPREQLSLNLWRDTREPKFIISCIESLIGRGDFVAADSHIVDLKSHYPDSTISLYMEARGFFHGGSYNEAKALFLRVIEKEPFHEMAWAHWAFCKVEESSKLPDFFSSTGSEIEIQAIKRVESELSTNPELKEAILSIFQFREIEVKCFLLKYKLYPIPHTPVGIHFFLSRAFIQQIPEWNNLFHAYLTNTPEVTLSLSLNVIAGGLIKKKFNEILLWIDEKLKTYTLHNDLLLIKAIVFVHQKKLDECTAVLSQLLATGKKSQLPGYFFSTSSLMKAYAVDFFKTLQVHFTEQPFSTGWMQNLELWSTLLSHFEEHTFAACVYAEKFRQDTTGLQLVMHALHFTSAIIKRTIAREDFDYVTTTVYKALHICREGTSEIAEVRLLAGQIYTDLSLYESAEEVLIVAKECPQRDLLLAKAFSFLNKNTLALVHINRLLAVVSTNAEYWILRAEISVKLDQTSSAIESYNEAIQLNPTDHKSFLARSIQYLTRSSRKVNKTQTSKDYRNDCLAALNDITFYLSINPKDERAWREKSRALGRLKMYNEAIEAINKSIDLNPSFLSNFELKGLYAQRAGLNALAWQCLHEIVNVSSKKNETENIFIWARAGIAVGQYDVVQRVLLGLRNLNETEEMNKIELIISIFENTHSLLLKKYLDDYIVKHPTSYQFLMMRAFYYVSSNRLSEALIDFQKFLENHAADELSQRWVSWITNYQKEQSNKDSLEKNFAATMRSVTLPEEKKEVAYIRAKTLRIHFNQAWRLAKTHNHPLLTKFLNEPESLGLIDILNISRNNHEVRPSKVHKKEKIDSSMFLSLLKTEVSHLLRLIRENCLEGALSSLYIMIHINKKIISDSLPLSIYLKELAIKTENPESLTLRDLDLIYFAITKSTT